MGNILQRFYKLKSGDILIDGVPLPELDLNFLRSNIGLVPQEPILFSGTVEENMAYGADVYS